MSIKYLNTKEVLICLIKIALIIVLLISICMYSKVNNIKSSYYVYKYDDVLKVEVIPYTYKKKNIDLTSMIRSYEDENYTSIFGLDISSFNGNIDYQKVKDAGVEFVFLRVGFRGYGQKGTLMKDSSFEMHYNGFKSVNIAIGVYFFSQATSTLEAMQEAYFVIENIKDKQIDLEVVYDLELIDDISSRTYNIDKNTATYNAIAFCDIISKNGYKPMIYTYLDWIKKDLYSLEHIYNYPIWFAQFNSSLNYFNKINYWQYSDKLKIEGIENLCDGNIKFIDK